MRLQTPRITRLMSEDGALTLAYTGFDMDRERGGWLMSLTGNEGQPPLAITATVAQMTTFHAREWYLARGRDIMDLDFIEMRVAIADYAEQFGKRFYVTSFVLSGAGDGSDLDPQEIRRATSGFIDLFFEMFSSHRLNRNEGGEGFYPDHFVFAPEELGPAFHLEARADREPRLAAHPAGQPDPPRLTPRHPRPKTPQRQHGGAS